MWICQFVYNYFIKLFKIYIVPSIKIGNYYTQTSNQKCVIQYHNVHIIFVTSGNEIYKELWNKILFGIINIYYMFFCVAWKSLRKTVRTKELIVNHINGITLWRCTVRLCFQLFVGGLMSWLRLLALSDVQQILCCIFVLFFYVLCTIWCQFLWFVHFWLPLRYSLKFICLLFNARYNLCDEVYHFFYINRWFLWLFPQINRI